MVISTLLPANPKRPSGLPLLRYVPHRVAAAAVAERARGELHAAPRGAGHRRRPVLEARLRSVRCEYRRH